MCWRIVLPSFFLQWKFDDSSKYYLTQILHATDAIDTREKM
jgi:hypothetical protein